MALLHLATHVALETALGRQLRELHGTTTTTTDLKDELDLPKARISNVNHGSIKFNGDPIKYEANLDGDGYRGIDGSEASSPDSASDPRGTPGRLDGMELRSVDNEFENPNRGSVKGRRARLRSPPAEGRKRGCARGERRKRSRMGERERERFKWKFSFPNIRNLYRRHLFYQHISTQRET